MNQKEKIIKIIADHSIILEMDILESDNLYELGIDSIDYASIKIELEKEFNIEINGDYVYNWDTVENVINSVATLINKEV